MPVSSDFQRVKPISCGLRLTGRCDGVVSGVYMRNEG